MRTVPEGRLHKAIEQRDAARRRAEKAEAENAALRKDAERYRWLRDAGWIDDAIMESNDISEDLPESLDKAIDAAIGKPSPVPEE